MSESLSGKYTVEWLEYGKLNVAGSDFSPGILGSSSGFPKALHPFCSPKKIASSTHSLDSPVKKGSSCTVLRVARLSSGEGISLAARIGQLSDSLESYQSSTTAHFACCAHSDPWILFSALQHHRPEVVSQSPEDLEDRSPWEVHVEAIEPRQGVLDFLNGGLKYVLSGIPLAIDGFVEEEEFFQLASWLWRAVPKTIQPLLGFGWGVESSLSGVLALSQARPIATYAACYQPHVVSPSEKWQRPSERVRSVGSTLEVLPFDRGWTLPGRVGFRALHGDSVDLKRLQRERPSTEGYLTEAQSWVDWRDARIQKQLRTPGVQELDKERRKLALERCHDKNEIAEKVLDQLATVIPEDRHLDSFLNKIVNGSCTSNALRLVKLLAQRSKASGVREFFDERANTLGNLFDVVFLLDRSDSFGARILERLGSLGRQSHHDALPSNLQAQLNQELDNSLKDEVPERVLKIHQQLLNGPHPEIYRTWLKERSSDLLLFLLVRSLPSEDPMASDLKSSIQTLSELGSFRVKALEEFLLGDEPRQKQVEALRKLSGISGRRWQQYFFGRWKHDPSFRDHLLFWLPTVPQGIDEPPLIKLARGQSLESEEILRLDQDVRDGTIPEGLLIPVAALTLHHWRLFTFHMQAYPLAWKPIVELWPAEVVRLLSPIAGLGQVDCLEPDPRVEEAAAVLVFTVDEFATMFEHWRVVRKKETVIASRMASKIWAWLEPPRPHLVFPIKFVDHEPQEHPLGILQKISRGEWPPMSSILLGGEYRTMTPAAELALFLHSGGIELAPKLIADLWRSAGRPWQLKLLLILFPQYSFELNWKYLGLLIPVRSWLKVHKHHLSAQHQVFYDIVIRNFHSATYPGDGALVFEEEMIPTPLWAIFKGVPFDRQGDLDKALKAYGRNLSEQAHLAILYIKAFRGEDLYLARQRVLKEFLLPVLLGRDHGFPRHCLTRRQILELVRKLLRREWPLDTFRDPTGNFVKKQRRKLLGGRNVFYVARSGPNKGALPEGPHLGILNDHKYVILDQALWNLLKGVFGKQGMLLSEEDLEAALEKWEA